MKQTSEKIIAAAEERGWINENEILHSKSTTMTFSKKEREFIVERMRYVGIEVYAATEHFVTCKGASWVPYAVAVAKRANAKVEIFKEPTGGGSATSSSPIWGRGRV